MQVVPLTRLDDELFRRALAVQQREEIANDPAIPPITEAELRRYARDDRTEGNRHERFGVVDGDEVRALVHLELEIDEANEHRAGAEIFGAADDPAAGRVGLGAALDLAEADGRTLITGWGPNTEAHRDFWNGVGAELRLRERISALDMPAVDGGLMDKWVSDGEQRAPDVRIIRWIGACPDTLMAPWLESILAMNDMPFEGLDINAWDMDEDDVREEEDAMDALGKRVLNMLAVDTDGRAAGHTRVHVLPDRPEASYQWDTAVVDRHRGRGVGKRLKADMWRWLRADEPDSIRLTTGNAQSNEAMLAINVAMGYTPVLEFGAWEAPIATVRATLS